MITRYTAGQGIKSAENNENEERFFDASMQNRFEILTDRTITLGKGQNTPFAEAYIDSDGRQNSVSLVDGSKVVLTTSTFNTDSFECNSDYVYPVEDSIGGPSPTEEITLDLTLPTAKTLADVSVDSRVAGSTGEVKVIYHYDDATTATVTDSVSNTSYATKTLTNPNAGKTVERVVFYQTNPSSSTIYSQNQTVEIGNVNTEIHHTISTGTFTDTASSAIAAVKIKDWEDGASLQYKLTNASEDTGWLDFIISGDIAYAKKSTFTALTAEPTKFILRLIPKSSSPTAGTPSVYASGVLVA